MTRTATITYTVWVGRLRLGDGGMHMLHLYGYGSQVGDYLFDYYPGFYPYDLYGQTTCTGPSTPSGDLSSERRTWFTADGSYLKLENGPSGYDSILYFPDGG
jgi:hypothetical protein